MPEENLKDEVDKLRMELEELKQMFRNSTEYQQDFGTLQIIRRKVKFTDEVFDKTGTKVIN